MRKHCRQLGTCVGAPGPHGFAVRIGIVRRMMPPRPSHPAPRFVTIAIRPSANEAGQRRTYNNFRFWKTEIFLRARIDRNLRRLPVGQINSRYQRNSSGRRVRLTQCSILKNVCGQSSAGITFRTRSFSSHLDYSRGFTGCLWHLRIPRIRCSLGGCLGGRTGK